MWFTKFLKANIKHPAKIAKALVKYGGRAILRRTNLFGIYGTFKKYRKLYKSGKYTKGKAFLKISKSVMKKNLLRSLGPANYIRDFFKRGAKYTLKQFAWNTLVPMNIKKLYYLNQNYKSVFGTKALAKESKKEIWKKLGRANHRNNDLWKAKQIQLILKTPIDDPKEKRFRKELLDRNFYFYVKSPQTANFSQRPCSWNPSTGKFTGYIRGWPKDHSGRGTKLGGPYTAIVDIDMVIRMIKTTNYGKMIYWKYFYNKPYNK